MLNFGRLSHTVKFSVVGAIVLSLSGCAGKPKATVVVSKPGAAPQVVNRSAPAINAWAEPVPGVLWARPGRTLVVPVEPTGEAILAGSVSAKFEGAEPFKARLVWIGYRPLDSGSTRGDAVAASAWRWLGRPGTWYSAAAPRRPEEGSVGDWFALVDIAPDAPPRVLTIAGQRLGLAWAKDAPFGSPARALEGEARAAEPAWTHAALALTRASPLTRWRARLARALPALGGPEAEDRFADPAVEALAEQQESQWGSGLDRLEAADAEVAASVRDRLSLMITFPGGLRAPAWSNDGESLSALLADLSDPDLPARARVLRASAWLAAQPAGAAWVSDDGGAADTQAGFVTGLVGVANLTPGLAAASLSLGERGTDDLASLPAWNAAALRARVHLEHGQEAGAERTGPEVNLGSGARAEPVVEARVHIGEWEAPRRLVAKPVAARPPGVSIGPLAPDWAMESFVASATSPGAAPGTPVAQRDWACAGIVQRDDAARAADRDGKNAPTSWLVFVESRVDPAIVPASGPAGDGDVVRLYFGPAGVPRVVLAVRSDGRLATEQAGAGRDEGMGTRRAVRFNRAKDRWSCWVPIPAEAVESMNGGFVVRLGMTRTDSRGERSAWPRPLLPWQTEPGRVLIDLSEWSRLGQGPAR